MKRAYTISSSFVSFCCGVVSHRVRRTRENLQCSLILKNTFHTHWHVKSRYPQCQAGSSRRGDVDELTRASGIGSDSMSQFSCFLLAERGRPREGGQDRSNATSRKTTTSSGECWKPVALISLFLCVFFHWEWTYCHQLMFAKQHRRSSKMQQSWFNHNN